MKNNNIILILVTLLSSGCATQGISTNKITPPNISKFNYEEKFNASQTVVWDRLVKNMAKSFFVINNIDKESRIINLSYSSDRPQDYVDCGQVHRTYKKGENIETYDYGFTDSIVEFKTSSEKKEDPRFSQVGVMVRNAKVDGRANVYVAPDGQGTVVTVNAKSLVKITSQGELITTNIVGAIISRRAIPPQSIEVVSVSKDSTETTFLSGTKVDKVTCNSTGKLEEEILSLAK